jgi:hypothetical protein
MSPFFTLAYDFIERMSNPAYGIRVNEDHALRFATLLESEGGITRLENEAKELSSSDSLTPHGWLWLLTWTRAQRIELNQELLLTLADTWSSVFMQVLVIDVATMSAEERPRERGRVPVSLSNISNTFLRELLQRVTHIGDLESRREVIPTQRAENTLVALLQIDRDVTIAAASSLLHHEWRGKSALLEFYRTLRNGFDEDIAKIWDDRLGQPQS